MPRNVRMAVVLRNDDLPLESWLRAERARKQICARSVLAKSGPKQIV